MRTARHLAPFQPSQPATSAPNRTAARVLPPRWNAAFEVLVEKECFEAPERALHAWTARVGPVLASGPAILRRLPGAYERVADCWLEAFDERGTMIGYALQAVVWACAAERAIFAYVDDARAGLSGAVSVYATDAAYRNALAAAVEAAQRRVAYL